MIKKTNTAATAAMIIGIGIAGFFAFRYVAKAKGNESGGSPAGGLFDLFNYPDANSEQMPPPVRDMEGQEGKTPPLTLPPEEEANLGVMTPMVSENGDSWYKEKDIGGILGWSPAEYSQRWAEFVASKQGSINLTAEERYAFDYADTMELAERQAASIERVYELGGYYEDGILQPPSDYPGSGPQWLARAREAGLLNDQPNIESTNTKSTSRETEKEPKLLPGGITELTYAGKGIPGRG